MGDFALVTEGVSDHAVLKNVLIGYYKDQGEPVITFEFPDPQATLHTGGWTLVLRYLREKKFRQAFQLNEYVVVQVDTDVSEEGGFDVPKQGVNGPLTVEAFVSNVVLRLRSEIGEKDWETHGDRFIFAVGVDQIECWVLPLWFHDAKGEQTANCIKRLSECPQLRDALDQRGYSQISSQHKDPLSYDFVSREYRKRGSLLRHGPRNPSMRIFLDELDRRAITLLEEE